MRCERGAILLALAALSAGPAGGESLGGFELSRLTVPRERVVAGGPGRDGIVSVDAPEFSHIGEATWIGRDTEVIGVELPGGSRAYPVRMLEYHQIVNDVVGGVPIAVTYDPLAGTPIAYRRQVGTRTLRFGVSGLLYNHNFLLYDRETESLWSQFLGQAIAGELSGQRLERVPVRQETAVAWVARHVDSLFLRPPAPEKVFYQMSPYASYWVQDKTIFPVAASDPTWHAKELVLGVVVGDRARAYLGSILTRDGAVEDEIAGRKIKVGYATETGTFRWEVDEGVQVTEAYWLAWKAFYPDTEVWHADAPGGAEAP
jgi:hypothetical protein